MKKTRTAQLWGGRFDTGPSPLLRSLNDSLAFDREIYPEEIRASRAWAAALRRAGALTSREAAKLDRALATMPAPRGDEALEDVHTYVEATLTRRLGPLGKKLHSGRSRNDQVAADFKLYLKSACGELEGLGLRLARELAALAAQEAATAMPGYTHLRRAEPVTLGHLLLAYVEMLSRDVARVNAILAVHDTCPLGSGALAGTPLPVDRERLARALGFARPTANSLDAVSDRDMAADYLHAATMTLVHLSRLAEDLIFLSSDDVAFVELPEAFATGSSRMPHKKNPDVLELARGHAGRAIGELAGLLALLKGLPLAYDKDLQLDKEPVFRMRRLLHALLPAVTGLVSGLRPDRAAMRRAASTDAVLATELADALAARGIPFREAHDLVGRRFREALEHGKSLRELGPGGGITAADLASLDVDRALARRASTGGTAPSRVKRAARAAMVRLSRATSRSVAAGRGPIPRPGAGRRASVGRGLVPRRVDEVK